jgi:hypothetical protein
MLIYICILLRQVALRDLPPLGFWILRSYRTLQPDDYWSALAYAAELSRGRIVTLPEPGDAVQMAKASINYSLKTIFGAA